ncbi:unnamed protein product, partial [Didymodactylos carnosus]
MDQYNSIFNSIYQVLKEHKLIIIDENEEKNRNAAYLVCVPILEKAIKYDETDTSKWIFELVSKLNIHIDEKKNLNEIFSAITLEIQALKDQLMDQQKKMEIQAGQIQTYESKLN